MSVTLIYTEQIGPCAGYDTLRDRKPDYDALEYCVMYKGCCVKRSHAVSALYRVLCHVLDVTLQLPAESNESDLHMHVRVAAACVCDFTAHAYMQLQVQHILGACTP